MLFVTPVLYVCVCVCRRVCVCVRVCERGVELCVLGQVCRGALECARVFVRAHECVVCAY